MWDSPSLTSPMFMFCEAGVFKWDSTTETWQPMTECYHGVSLEQTCAECRNGD